MLPQEYVETGGARWGVINATWPFGSLRASREKILIEVRVMRVTLVRFEFRCDQIVSIQEFRGLINTGMRIRHTILEYPNSIIFWTFNPRKPRNALSALGYTINNI